MHRVGRSWRWGVVVGVVAILAAAPAAVSSWPVRAAELTATELVAAVAASGDQPYEAYVAVRGSLALPSVGPLDDVAALLGKASHLRAWVAGPDRWRVDRLSLTGEVDTYRDGATLTTWDSSARRTVRSPETGQLRLPRPADLLPADLGRRLVAAISPGDEVEAVRSRRLAGHATSGVRIVPGSPSSTIAYADLWVDERTGVTLAVDVTARGGKAPVLTAEALTLSYGAPDPAVVAFDAPTGPGFRVRSGDRALDVVQQVARSSPIELPDLLGDLPRAPGQTHGIATYGRGFDAVVLVGVPAATIPSGLARLPASPRPWGGEAIVVETALLKAELVTTDGVSYLVAGAVSIDELDRFAAELVGRP